MGEATFVQVVTTLDDRDAALALARSAVEAKVAACAQVGGPIRSVYRWQGAIEEAEEFTVVLKTTAAGYPALERHLLDRHPYETPEIVCTPVLAGNPAYLAWVTAETGQ
ncbi:divalent cation tolerance protein [Catellatospora methionotrophica]|uniref:Divalent cation tolerance protein n=1 Tax=Catellatospora methionotrophica TaxID=121620 RepID=A0A8J3LHA1_9ACTN|nr:divalent-cation tolerance protein CutA [Catellatospora methionotrophica]GIG18245.1 divalent cation tolerance protein [Catellatospora methionotrophica]